ncbi:hypothetical protein GNI_116430 [Gregarina niphandrodes]|uniref:Uncharacterized protein n=1 Tax=Gregarina niphandrodes TaxID=110365 RepID=A0A023B2U5_GRENI|nr:hypothetical protein GNI_116430 [Gregarina niphandrodes]EZG55203.1 hypothetical protein GNI_116430 [Gregarina niphandrodes]|eukprot:XP_011131730.1 hypothetical protein GNI_116430 [Gregarina niphandrodes]
MQQATLEYANAFSNDPKALMVMARRLSRFAHTCAAGLTYISTASSLIAHETFVDPSSVYFPQPTANEISNNNLGSYVANAHRDLSVGMRPHVLSAFSLSVQNKDNERLVLPSAQRIFTGADRFEQSWSRAVEMVGEFRTNKSRHGETTSFLANSLTKLLYNRMGALNDPDEYEPVDYQWEDSSDRRGRGLTREEITDLAAFTARVAIGQLPLSEAHDALGLSLMIIASDPGIPDDLRAGLILEARQQFVKTPDGSFNALALDLTMAAPILSNSIFAVTPQLQKLNPATTHVVAQITGDIGCTESWSLMTQTVRHYLWYHANKHAFNTPGFKKYIDQDILGELARAGVEEAEWSLATQLSDDDLLKQTLLSFSAHRGRTVAQLNLARLARDGKIRIATTDGKKNGMGVHESAGMDASMVPDAMSLMEEDAVLDAWNPSEFPLLMTKDELAQSHLELITETPMRWEDGDLSSPEFAAAYTEALLDESWNAFFGLGRPQSLRDCLVVLNKVPFRLIKHAYLGLYQVLMLLNGFLHKII